MQGDTYTKQLLATRHDYPLLYYYLYLFFYYCYVSDFDIATR
jgi:hypothetical protein